MGCFLLAKYTGKFKSKIAKEYLEGKLSYRSLAEKYEIPTTTLRGWVRIYKHFGEKQLVVKNKDQEIYSVQFKQDVLSFMKSTGASASDTALQFGIKNPSMLSRWRKSFQEGKSEAQNNQRELLPMPDKSKKQKKKPINNKETATFKQLERENELLRLEVAYLKKLRAFQEDPEAFLEKHKQRYQPNSKNNSN